MKLTIETEELIIQKQKLQEQMGWIYNGLAKQ